MSKPEDGPGGPNAQPAPGESQRAESSKSSRFLWPSVGVLSAALIGGMFMMSEPPSQSQNGAAQAAVTPHSGNAENGQLLFTDTCGICHDASADGKNKLGPNLFGVLGRKSATGANYTYSTAMMEANLVWDEPTLFDYLAGPQKKVPGTKMGFQGFSDARDRANVIAYLATLK